MNRLDFDRRETRRLGQHLHLDVRHVGVGIDRNRLKGEDSGNGQQTGQSQDQDPLPQRKFQKRGDHSVGSILCRSISDLSTNDPLVTTCSPALTPSSTVTTSPCSLPSLTVRTSKSFVPR